MAKGFSVFVSIGARLMPSMRSSILATEQRFSQMGRRIKMVAAESKVALKEINAAGAGIAGIAAAGGLTFGVSKAIGQGAGLQHELNMLKLTGRTANEMAAAMRHANRTVAALPTTSITDNIRALNEGIGAFGDFRHAIENLTFNQKVGSMMKNMLGGDYDAGHAIAAGIRALEIRGSAMDRTKYQKEMGELYKSMIFFRERFSPDELAGFGQTGNIPLKGYNTRFLTRILPSIIQEFGGGDTTGTMASAFRNQIMGRVPLGGKKLTDEWVRLGLVPKVGTGGNESRTGWTAGVVRGHSLAMADPFAWVEKYLLPAMRSKGINIDDTQAVLTQVSTMFGRETAIRFVSTLAEKKQRYRLHRDEANINNVVPLDKAYAATLRNDPVMAWGAMKSSFANMSAIIFGTSMKDSPIAVAMTNIAQGINAVAASLQRHSWIAKGIGATLLGGAGLASLKLIGVSLRWAFSPLKFMLSPVAKLGSLLWRSLGPAAFKGLLRFGTWARAAGVELFTAVRGLGRFAAAGFRALGPFFTAGLRTMAPFLLGGLRVALGVLTGPVGWALLAVSAGALIYRFRNAIGSALAKGWSWIKATFTSVDWAGIGKMVARAIADGLTFGLASKLPGIARGFAGAWRANMPVLLGGAPAARPNIPDPATAVPVRPSALILKHPAATPGWSLAGARRRGGPVSGGESYLVGEEGPEIFTPRRSGTIIPNRELVRRRDERATIASKDIGPSGGPSMSITININGVTDPRQVGLEVERHLGRMAHAQGSYLSD
jgi:hypothetical protein